MYIGLYYNIEIKIRSCDHEIKYSKIRSKYDKLNSD